MDIGVHPDGTSAVVLSLPHEQTMVREQSRKPLRARPVLKPHSTGGRATCDYW